MKSAVVLLPGLNRDRDMIAALTKISGKPPVTVWQTDTEIPDVDLIATAQTEATQYAELQAAEAAKSFIAGIDKMAKNAPQGLPGADYALSAVKAGVETSMAAFETVAKATKDGVEFAGSQVKAASKAAPKRK